MSNQLHSEALRVARLLRKRAVKMVLAESCTGGLVAAALAGIPGISAHLCGSAVVYRVGMKSEWLGIPESLLEDPGPVSESVAAAMADRVLERTPEANLAVSVTGHLGPDAPPGQNGLLYLGVACRPPLQQRTSVLSHRLADAAEQVRSTAVRRRRQREAARLVLETVVQALNAETGHPPGEAADFT